PASKKQGTKYNSLYGNTAGLRGPNDGFHIWNQFFGEDRYDIPERLSDELQTEMQRLFAAWLEITKRPLLNKNNRNTVCCATIANALPNARFVIVERRPWFVAQSLIKARKWVQGSKKLGWGLGAESVQQGTDHLAYVEAVCKQVANHQKQLHIQMQAIQPERVLYTTYESFCSDPAEFVEQAMAWLPEISMRDGRTLESLSPFRCSDKWSLPAETVDRIQSLLPESIDGKAEVPRPHFSQATEVARREPPRP
ncbi:MAG: sulfotransferase, partial [Lacipirellulaceae bacterium]